MKKLILIVVLLTIQLVTQAQTFVVTKTSPIPATGITQAHTITFSTTGKQQAQLWTRDVVVGYFRQLTGYLDLSTGAISIPIWMLTNSNFAPNGEWICAFVYPDNTKSNEFNVILASTDVTTGFTNLGAAQQPFTIAEAYDAGLLNSSAAKPAPVKKNNGK